MREIDLRVERERVQIFKKENGEAYSILASHVHVERARELIIKF
jgi:hypothetical protein